MRNYCVQLREKKRVASTFFSVNKIKFDDLHGSEDNDTGLFARLLAFLSARTQNQEAADYLLRASLELGGMAYDFIGNEHSGKDGFRLYFLPELNKYVAIRVGREVPDSL